MHNQNDNSSLNFTGERLVTKINEYWTLEHLHRYAIVKDLVIGKDILDIACGEGYGSNLLSDYANSVIGIDISSEAVNHAASKYKKDNLRFQHGSTLFIDLPELSIDIVISFETIEHLVEHDTMLQQIKKILKTNGVLIISSPDKKNYSDIPRYVNPFHLKELYKSEFESLIKKYFDNTLMLFQKSAVASVITTGTVNSKIFKEFEGNYTTISENQKPTEDALYNICIASAQKKVLDELQFNSIFFDKDMNDFYFNNSQKYNDINENYLNLQKQLNSYSYKIGRIVTYPFRFFKKLIFYKR